MLSICLRTIKVLGRCSTLAAVSGCFFCFLFPLLGYVIFLYATEIKTSQECLFIEQYLVHFLVLFYV